MVIKNDKGGLSKKEIDEERLKHAEEKIGNDLEPAMILERNYKKEINLLYNKINTLTALTIPNPNLHKYLLIKKLLN